MVEILMQILGDVKCPTFWKYCFLYSKNDGVKFWTTPLRISQSVYLYFNIQGPNLQPEMNPKFHSWALDWKYYLISFQLILPEICIWVTSDWYFEHAEFWTHTYRDICIANQILLCEK